MQVEDIAATIIVIMTLDNTQGYPCQLFFEFKATFF